jgi:hypothetical protein
LIQDRSTTTERQESAMIFTDFGIEANRPFSPAAHAWAVRGRVALR